MVSKKLMDHSVFSIPNLMHVTEGAWTNHKAIGLGRIINEQMLQVMDFRRMLFYKGCQNVYGPKLLVVHRFKGLGTEAQGIRRTGPVVGVVTGQSAFA